MPGGSSTGEPDHNANDELPPPDSGSATPVDNSKSYLLVTLDAVRIRDDQDDYSTRGAGDIYLRCDVGETSKSQGTSYPFPDGPWIEVYDGDTMYPNLPIYIMYWDGVPERLPFFLTVYDNDQGPAWVSTVAYLLSQPLDLASDAAAMLWKLSEEPGRFITKQLDPSDPSKPRNPGEPSEYTAAQFLGDLVNLAIGVALAHTAPMQLLNEVNDAKWHVDRLLDLLNVLKDAQKADIVAAVRHVPTDGPSELTKADNWGIRRGTDRATYVIDEKGSITRGLLRDCPAGSSALAQISFWRVTDTPQHLHVKVTLESLTIKENGEDDVWEWIPVIGVTPQIFAYSRVVDWTDPVPSSLFDVLGENPELDPTLRTFFKVAASESSFIGTVKRLPGDSEFWSTADGGVERLDTVVFDDTLTAPLLYVELNVYENDADRPFEDALDWLGSFSFFRTAQELASGSEWRVSLTSASADAVFVISVSTAAPK
jgi:hypothetical protein